MKYLKPKYFVIATVALLSACRNETKIQQTIPANSGSIAQINTSLFSQDAMVQSPEIVSCTLENEATSDCAQFVVKYKPDSSKIGPFCPETLNDIGGIWDWDGTNAGLYRVDETFLRMLDQLGYTFYDDDGSVHIADIAKAEPVHDHACINVSADETVEITVLLPVTPALAQAPTQLGVVSKVGLALDGIPIFSDAPSIKRTGHMPSLDTCGGHIDPGGWYHFHGAASDINVVFDEQNIDAKCDLPQDSSALFGYAFDGFPIYGSTEKDGSQASNLDVCNGHVVSGKESGEQDYHYHASTDFPNLPPCLVGVVAKDNFMTTAQVGVGANPPDGTEINRRDPPGGGGNLRGHNSPPGFAEAAEKLGISEEELIQTMQEAGGPQADLSQVAKKLGVSEADLRKALPSKPN